MTYQTDAKGERLDRVRFLIRNEQQQEHMYPKGVAYVDDVERLTRMVIIDDLPAGNYFLEFIIPNADNLFEEVPIRAFSIVKGEVAKIDQVCKPRYVAAED